jgi:(R,R)-butanediol dehydrogenase/meso-butanediol dehydrogenase/diacetyl reductase
MRAARFHGAGDIRVEAVPEPGDPGPGEVLLAVRAVGVCGSDAVEYTHGPALVHDLGTPHPVTGHLGPLTLGHELAGEVAAVGDGVDGVAPGTLVACGAGMSCGACGPCRAGRTNLCETYATIGFHRDGGLAEYCLAPASICADAGAYGLTPDGAALAQPMSIAVHAARRGRASSGETALVIGAGGIGAFLTWVLASWGVDVAVTDLDEARLAVAAGLGAGATIPAGGELPAADVVFEVSGTEVGLATAIALVPRGGRVVAVGHQHGTPPVDMKRITFDELELIGTVAHVCGDDLPEALRLLALRRKGWGDVAPEVLALEELVDDGIVPMAERRATRIKTLVDPAASVRRASDTVPAG